MEELTQAEIEALEKLTPKLTGGRRVCASCKFYNITFALLENSMFGACSHPRVQEVSGGKRDTLTMGYMDSNFSCPRWEKDLRKT